MRVCGMRGLVTIARVQTRRALQRCTAGVMHADGGREGLQAEA
jgi:hypothetical protein